MNFCFPIVLAAAIAVTGCARLEKVGKAPDFKSTNTGNEHFAMMRTPLPDAASLTQTNSEASLWRAGRTSLLGNQRAQQVGDIVTVVIEIDERAEISNSTSRSRGGSEQLGIPNFLGIPQRLERIIPEDQNFDTAVSTNSASSSNGDGSVRRNEKFSLRVAATVTGVLENGVLTIEGSQEVRVNFELRELLVRGYVRPNDISRQNEITYDKIAGARISYGGRGQITDVQQPRVGQQISDIILPF